MSPRRLLGWEPGEVTSFEYDEQGRVVRAITTREPEFTQSDVSALIASRQHENSLLSHGYSFAEATSPEANPYSSDAKYRFVADKPVTDFAAQAIEQAQNKFYEQWPDAPRGSHLWPVKKVPIEGR